MDSYRLTKQQTVTTSSTCIVLKLFIRQYLIMCGISEMSLSPSHKLRVIYFDCLCEKPQNTQINTKKKEQQVSTINTSLNFSRLPLISFAIVSFINYFCCFITDECQRKNDQ